MSDNNRDRNEGDALIERAGRETVERNEKAWTAKIEAAAREAVAPILGDEFASKIDAVVKTVHDKIIKDLARMPPNEQKEAAIAAARVAAFTEKFQFEAIVASLLKKSSRLASNWGVDAASAEDIINEAATKATRTFAKSPEAFDSMAPNDFRKRWFNTVLRNTRMDYHRGEKKRKNDVPLTEPRKDEEGSDSRERPIASEAPSPERVGQSRYDWAKVASELSAQEERIWIARHSHTPKTTWPEIAAQETRLTKEIHTPEQVRKIHERSVERVKSKLRLPHFR